ncbi:MAG: bifunctional metallophosphatase/5'-nucleotidase [Bacteroidetes bacterium]|nr:MAG: bifunctional metallophosphatase/5'-nucleotidase [Bacteroidota bacterium]
MNRKDFLKYISFTSAGVILTPWKAISKFAAEESIKISVLHTNDWHSHIDPFPHDDPKYPGLGGAAKRSWLIQQIRKREKNVLLLDAGDVFQGTPYFNFYGGKLEFELMSKMKYDAATLGNHDFDNGLQGLKKMLPFAQFPFVNTNYDFSDTILHNQFKPYQIFTKQNVKIGVLGVGVELNGLVSKKNYENTRYLDPISSVQKTTDILRNDEKCDIVICLSHLGYKYNSNKVSDIVLAKETHGIDIIIGGHTHTFLDKPDIQKNKKGKPVVINQVGWAGVRLGKIDIFYHPQSGESTAKASFFDIF